MRRGLRITNFLLTEIHGVERPVEHLKASLRIVMSHGSSTTDLCITNPAEA
jgi:hypothetical protein